MIEREPFLNKLKNLKPALQPKDIIEELLYLWFTGSHAIASNSSGFGIRVECKTDFKGGLLGVVLLGILANSKAKEFDLVEEDNKWVLKAGKTRLVLTSLPLSQMMAELPIEKTDKEIKVSTELLSALGKVLISAGNVNSKYTEQTGITIIKQDSVYVFGTDDTTIAQVKCKGDSLNIKEGHRVCLPTPFIEQLLEISKGKDTKLYISKDSVYASTKEMLVFARLIGVEEPSDLVKICKNVTKDNVVIPIPSRLKFALARTFVLLDKQKDGMVRIIIKNNTLKIETSSALGDLKDTMTLEGDHPDASTNLDPKLIKRALLLCKDMSINNKAMILGNKDFTYLIAEHS